MFKELGLPKILKIAASVALMTVLTGCADTYSAPKTFTVSNATVEKAVKGAIGSDLKGAPSASCKYREYCAIDYTIDEQAGISTDIEMIEPTRQIWKALFADSKFKNGIMTVSGPTTTTGGKSGTSRLFTLSCDRKAASEINWDAVTGKGMRALCRYSPKVQGL